MRRILILMICLLLLGKSAEAATESFGVIDIMSRVDITNVDNEKVKMFHDVTDFLVSKISAIPNVAVYDLSSDSVKARLDEIYLQLSQGNCSEFNDVNCDYLIYGYLMNLTVSEGRRIAESSEAVRADLSIRVVDVKSGKCVFVATGTGVSKVRNYGIFKYKISGSNFSEEELHSALSEATNKIIEKLKSNI